MLQKDTWDLRQRPAVFRGGGLAEAAKALFAKLKERFPAGPAQSAIEIGEESYSGEDRLLGASACSAKAHAWAASSALPRAPTGRRSPRNSRPASRFPQRESAALAVAAVAGRVFPDAAETTRRRVQLLCAVARRSHHPQRCVTMP